MDSQKFDPEIFINDVQRLCGNLDQESLQLVKGFAINIGDQSKLNQCLKHTRMITNGLSQDVIWFILLWIFTVCVHIRVEKRFKSLHDKMYRSIAKAQDSHLEKLNKAIELLAEEGPDPSKFDKGYMLNLAKRNTARRIFNTKFDILVRDLIEANERTLGISIPKKKNPKGLISINLFIYSVHHTVRRFGSTMKDNAICNRLASLLTILTGKKYTRQNVYGILNKKTKIPAQFGLQNYPF